ncbi:MAG: redoxin family protein [Myxococcota bacterium]|nr:redoxin family protein [Myxococcota bacterium]
MSLTLKSLPRFRTLAGLALMVGLCVALTASAKVQTGTAAPDFQLTDQAGKTHKLSQYRGKTVVLEWTNPTCPFVVRHYRAKTMTKLAAANPEVVWLTIDSSNYFDAAKGQQWASAHGVRTLLGDASGKVGRLYGAQTTPHMFVIDPQGKIAYQGAVDNDPYNDKEGSARRNYVAAAIKAISAGQAPTEGDIRPYGCSVKYAR